MTGFDNSDCVKVGELPYDVMVREMKKRVDSAKDEILFEKKNKKPIRIMTRYKFLNDINPLIKLLPSL